MSFTRRIKYGNVMATRKLKKSVSLERIEMVLFLCVATVSMFAMNVAITSM
jgi:hypothetical protein